MNDFDARNYGSSGGFVKKADLRENGPRKFVVADVEEADGFPDKAGKATKELVLVFADGSKQSLRARAQRDTMVDLFGHRTSKWIGKEIELYCDLSVFNPRGGDQGGIRIRRPDARQEDEELDAYVSDLDDLGTFGERAEAVPPPPPKGNGGLSTRPRSKGKGV